MPKCKLFRFEPTPALAFNTWAKVDITQLSQFNGTHIFSVKIDDVEAHKMENETPVAFEKVKTLTSDSDVPTAIARIDNISIETRGNN